MTNTRPGSTPEVIGAGPTGPARTTGLLYLGLAVTGALGFQLVRGQIYVADDPGGTLSTWSNTPRWRALASCSSWASS